jgi:hypothetical protein
MREKAHPWPKTDISGSNTAPDWILPRAVRDRPPRVALQIGPPTHIINTAPDTAPRRWSTPNSLAGGQACVTTALRKRGTPYPPVGQAFANLRPDGRPRAIPRSMPPACFWRRTRITKFTEHFDETGIGLLLPRISLLLLNPLGPRPLRTGKNGRRGPPFRETVVSRSK